ncbi:hypothetical protein CBR_g19987 [Chara braunii]|uniref:Uncharacterized protein n=1 Tax=Chara braunii TaxID=69332 RepID=A0A388KZ62_CHABU|nr:hypothetical protein CBR_g19987 [Chara braunii]|eukprot:GBG75354.1 hypothetical protein CBR_g19987 [Chara braunii]
MTVSLKLYETTQPSRCTTLKDQDVGDVYAGATYQKISAHGGSVDYADHQYSAQVINQPTKFVIPASDRGALQSVQLEYPRTRMGVTRYDVKHAGEFKL